MLLSVIKPGFLSKFEQFLLTTIVSKYIKPIISLLERNSKKKVKKFKFLNRKPLCHKPEMRLFSLYPNVSMNGTCGKIEPGKMYISQIEYTPVHKNLKIHGGNLYLSEELSILNYLGNGHFTIPDIGMYLGINEDGRFSVEDHPQARFMLENVEDSARVLAFGFADEFQLCADNLIGYNSNCRGGVRVTITYESMRAQSFLVLSS